MRSPQSFRLSAGDETCGLDRLVNSAIAAEPFQGALHLLHQRFNVYASTCPVPLPAPDLIVTPEIRRQSELYLPMARISALFNRLYRRALRYPPILGSTPFSNRMSWADTYQALPPHFRFSPNPAILLESLLSDRELLTEFLFASFLPQRFYGGFARYPGQLEFIRKWIPASAAEPLRCLDAACGTGEDVYGLASLLMHKGWKRESLLVEGWTLEPLEVWAAARRCFPHDRLREERFLTETSRVFEQGYHSCILFRCVDLTEPLRQTSPPYEVLAPGLYNLVLCNGLLGGPIIHSTEKVERVIANLVSLLAPGGVLLTADSFHAGWKQRLSPERLKKLFGDFGLTSFEAGEGIGGEKI